MPDSRANIIHFETLSLYQNVSYKMSLCYRFNTKYSKIISLLEKRYHFHS